MESTGKNADFIRAMLFHLGENMWSDIPVKEWGPYRTPEELADVCAADHVRCDEALWRCVTERAAACGTNVLIIDLGEAMVYPSHPELAVRGSWSPEKMRRELERLRKLGLEPIPKLNFSTSHDTWLKEYGRMVSTPDYYRVCEDVIRDTIEIFDRPRFFHLGYDEEWPGHQRQYAYMAVRQGALWWHDFLYISGLVEKQGVRPWVWADYYWKHREDYERFMPRSILQSIAYYDVEFDRCKLKPSARNRLDSFINLDRAGFEQVPVATNWAHRENVGLLTAFLKRTITSGRLKGQIMAPWFMTNPKWKKKLLEGIDLFQAALRENGYV